MSDRVNHNPDVLSCLANLSNDEVLTPPEVANAMLDMLPQELFRDPNAKFLDPACKSGIFLREIAKRLLDGLIYIIPDRQKRIDHIFHKQLYGIAITELTSLLTRRSLYCSKHANSIYSVTSFEEPTGKIRFKRIEHTWDGNGKCQFCGASREQFDRGDELETHAYEFIHIKNTKELEKVKFDLIISNPPYQLNDGGSGTGISAKPLYHNFVEQAKKLKPRYLSMIIPSRWFAGGKGLDSFRNSMLKDSRVKIIVDYMSSKDCFPGVNIAGGVNYFLWDRDYNGLCEIRNCANGKDSVITLRALDEFSVFIRNNIAISIIHKFLESKDENLEMHTYTRNPFGFVSSERGLESAIQGNEYVKLLSSGGIGFVKRADITKNHTIVSRYKTIIGKVVPSNGEVDTKPEDGYKVITSSKILGPNVINTETYLLLRDFDNLEEAQNFCSFMALKFPRYMMKQTLSSMNISKQNFMFVPFLSAKKKWTDEELYARYALSEDEIGNIEYTIREMETSEVLISE